jgi:simple sugar transport system substrate-binding protein
MIRKRILLVGAVALSATIVLTACSSSGGAAATSASSAAAGGQVATTEHKTIAMITFAAPGDTFWDKVRAGADAAGAKDNFDVKYTSDPSTAGQSTLIQNAVDSKVDGIAVAMADPEALKTALQSATAAGIPIVGFNSGQQGYKDVGALMWFGADNSLAGEGVGQRIADAGGKHPLCIIMEAGQLALEDRCAGVKSKVPGTENIQVNGTDMSSVQGTVTAKLQQDPSIDWVVTLGAPFAMGVLPSLQETGSTAKLATFDLNADAANAIKDGKIEFAVDQQPYLEGYLAVDSLWLYLTNHNDIGGGGPVLTGPSFVDKSNIDEIASYAANGTR